MLIQAEITSFIHTTYKEEILKQCQFSSENLQMQSSHRLEINLKLDLSKTLKKNSALGSFIIGNYCAFVKFSEIAAYQLLENFSNATLAQEQICLNFYFSSCPLSRHNLQSSEFLSKTFQHPSGVLVYIKEIHILKVGQPELYLANWSETWSPGCLCSCSRKDRRKFKQSLIQIVRHQKRDLKNVVSFSETPRCQDCHSKMKSLGRENQIYKNCQKIRFLANMTSGESCEEAFHEGIFEAYVDQNNMGIFTEGSIFDICAFIVGKTVFSRLDTMSVKPQIGLYTICAYPSKLQNSTNNFFFGNLRRFSLSSKKCEQIKDFDTMLQNFNEFQKTINKIKFPYLHSDSMTALKYCIVNSVFCHHRNIKLNLLLVSDQPNIIQKSISLPHLSIKKFPTIFDSNTLQSFLLGCHHSILLMTNPTKKDLQAVHNFLENPILAESLNMTLWVLLEPEPWKQIKKEIRVEDFPIILDLSFEKNLYICRGIYEDLIDQKLGCFLRDSTRSQILEIEDNQIITVEKKFNRKKGLFYDQQEKELTEQDMIEEDCSAKNLLQKYFLKSRDYKKITPSTLQNIMTIAQGFAYFRYFLNKIPEKPGENVRITLLDAILAIFIDEESSRHRHAASSTLFANEISKLILNEDNCQLSFWDYDYQENGDIEENKHYISKDGMFKRMLWKLVRLLEEGELELID